MKFDTFGMCIYIYKKKTTKLKLRNMTLNFAELKKNDYFFYNHNSMLIKKKIINANISVLCKCQKHFTCLFFHPSWIEKNRLLQDLKTLFAIQSNYILLIKHISGIIIISSSGKQSKDKFIDLLTKMEHINIHNRINEQMVVYHLSKTDNTASIAISDVLLHGDLLLFVVQEYSQL